MLLIVSTLDSKIEDLWFYNKLIDIGKKRYGGTIILGPYFRELEQINDCLKFNLSWDFLDRHADLTKIDKKNNIDLKTSFNIDRWLIPTVSLVRQNASTYSQTSLVLENYKQWCASLLSVINPELIILSNPGVVHTGMFNDIAKFNNLDVLYFERTIVKNTFDVNQKGTGHLSPICDLKLDIEQNTRGGDAATPISVDSRKTTNIDWLKGNNDCFTANCIGVLGIDDASTGVFLYRYKNTDFPINIAQSSLDAAIKIAERTDLNVVFKPHPSSIHLVGRSTYPPNLSIYVGNLDFFCKSVSKCVGFGSTSDLSYLSTARPFILAGKSFLSDTRLTHEAHEISQVLIDDEQNYTRTNLEMINHRINYIYNNYLIGEHSLERLERVLSSY